MKFLIVGESHRWSAETSYARELQCAGCHAQIWNNKRPRVLFGNRDWWRMGPAMRATYDIVASAAFLRKAIRSNPDVIFTPKAENIHSRAIRIALERTDARLITWYPDHPFKADMSSMNVLRNLPRYDIFYIWGHFLEDTICAAGAPRVEYLPFAFDPEMHPANIPINDKDRERFASDICFVGAWDREREQDLEPLCRFDLAIWGPGWRENTAPSSPVRAKIRGGALYNEDLVKAYLCSIAVFNHLRRHNGSAHNMRAMEIAGIGGGVQLTRRTPELASELFKDGEHLLCYGSPEEMADKVRWALVHRDEVDAMAARAREHVFTNHLLEHRISRILADLAEVRDLRQSRRLGIA